MLESGSVSYGKATPYLPVIELLKAYCRIQERDDPRVIRERVAGKLLMLDRALEPLLTPLLALLDVPVDDAAWDALDPPQRRQRTLEAVKRLLLRESQVQPLLVIFEDLHWIDTETQALLDGLMESLPDGPRPAPRQLPARVPARLGRARPTTSSCGSTRCRPRAPQSCSRPCSGEDRTLDPLKRMLIERTEGNPFFLEESVQTLVETQVLVGERGAYRLVKAPDAWQIPATAQTILAARIDRLAPADKRLLQIAAVIGKDVPFALSKAFADVPEESFVGCSPTSRRPSSCTRRVSSRISSTPSSIRSPTRSPTPSLLQGAAGSCMPGSSARSRRSTSIVSMSTSNGWPSTPCVENSGRRPSTISGARAVRRRHDRRYWMLDPGSSRRWGPSTCCRRARPRWSNPSRYAWSYDGCC